MTALTIGTDDMDIIQKIQDMIVQKFHCNVQIETKEPSDKPQTRWGKFADRMSGLTTPDITRHIEQTHQEIREDFTIRPIHISEH